MVRRIVLFSAVLLLLSSMPVIAQQCGDVTGDGGIDIADISYLMNYFYLNGAPWNARMDMDDRAGVSHGDLVRIVDNIFVQWPNGVYDCSPGQTYSMAPSPNDTLFIPRLTSVPNGIDEVTLVFKGNLQPGAAGICSFFKMMPGSAGGFRVVDGGEYQANKFISINLYWQNDRTLPLYGSAKYDTDDILAGPQDLFWIKFGRITPGSTGADLILVENQIDPLRRICISRGGDLVVPTIVYYEHQFPLDTLKTSVTGLTFSTAAGRPARDTANVTFTSTGQPISFDLTAIDPWVKMPGLPSGRLTTPVTVKVTADGTTLVEGNYTSALRAENGSSLFGVYTPLPELPVSVAVGPPVIYPPGDVNCNGVVDLTDLSMMIAYLLGFTQSLPACY